MAELNFHHLRYFWVIAHRRSLTRAAEELHVSPSALSIQLRQLEERLGQPLFERRQRRLVLTEAGRIALDHADTIFKAGDELVGTLKGRPRAAVPVLHVGAVATLSRNFQLAWLRPLLGRDDVRVHLHAGRLRELLVQLGAHALDVVLTNEPVPGDRASGWRSRLIARQPVSLVSRKPRGRTEVALRFPHDLHDQPLVLPGESSGYRSAFDLALEAAGVRPRVLAEVDDMAMLRLLARETGVLALVPPVVVHDELAQGVLVERCSIPSIEETFYAITVQRRYPHPLLRELLAAG
ncbi:LysR substrate-binding domain-containing protein [Calidifontimicrobium sp. SYSU G02091]|uniref:LysR family transcriptional regulator n=1 Tax=Calidifontimicrobium sp. SYSU G02091 TaxID=2926421 RepID=UPI001F5380DC|nr:LysR family transcriptional regulator [Calidifontimicrobium sp. SYSU G02091]MCI1191304.1 LysR substrate-binding domain-containing protein [Calidifontimicrobium sp. SYSU G02091]